MTSIHSKSVPQSLIDFASSLADAASAVTMRHFRQPIDVETKADASPVTIADKQAELAIRALIEKTYPGHGVIGEEFPPVNPGSEFVWVIDPIDGTKSFITGRPLFGTLIALMWQGEAALGVIEHAALGERWIGATGHPTTFNGNPVRARACPNLVKSALMTSSPHYYKGTAVDAFERLRRSGGFVMYGTECMAYGLVASGFADIAIEAGMDIFDYLAAVPVIEGAGGIMTDWQGRRLDLTSGDQVIGVGDPRIHDEALSLLNA
jgi:inositol-phosphate phosphatase/L-galactose 1-phosphate phosphatase/histidinol-phosphatase